MKFYLRKLLNFKMSADLYLILKIKLALQGILIIENENEVECI
jgi:hypothetical protein